MKGVTRAGARAAGVLILATLVAGCTRPDALLSMTFEPDAHMVGQAPNRFLPENPGDEILYNASGGQSPAKASDFVVVPAPDFALTALDEPLASATRAANRKAVYLDNSATVSFGPVPLFVYVRAKDVPDESRITANSPDMRPDYLTFTVQGMNLGGSAHFAFLQNTYSDKAFGYVEITPQKVTLKAGESPVVELPPLSERQRFNIRIRAYKDQRAVVSFVTSGGTQQTSGTFDRERHAEHLVLVGPYILVRPMGVQDEGGFILDNFAVTPPLEISIGPAG